jgi:hypothetical protein
MSRAGVSTRRAVEFRRMKNESLDKRPVPVVQSAPMNHLLGRIAWWWSPNFGVPVA